MEEKRDSFVFYRSYREAIKELPENEKLNVYEAIVEYALNGVELELTGVSKAIFIMMKPLIDSSQKRYEISVINGKKGGAPIGNQNARKQPEGNLKTTKKQPKNNLNDNDNVNDNNICPSCDEQDLLLKVEKDSQLAKDFDKIWILYPRKEGKNTAFRHYKAWLNGKKYAGKTIKLTNRQMWFATKKYADLLVKNKTEKQFIKMGSTFFNEAIIEYVEEEKDVGNI